MERNQEDLNQEILDWVIRSPMYAPSSPYNLPVEHSAPVDEQKEQEDYNSNMPSARNRDKPTKRNLFPISEGNEEEELQTSSHILTNQSIPDSAASTVHLSTFLTEASDQAQLKEIVNIVTHMVLQLNSSSPICLTMNKEFAQKLSYYQSFLQNHLIKFLTDITNKASVAITNKSYHSRQSWISAFHQASYMTMIMMKMPDHVAAAEQPTIFKSNPKEIALIYHAIKKINEKLTTPNRTILESLEIAQNLLIIMDFINMFQSHAVITT